MKKNTKKNMIYITALILISIILVFFYIKKSNENYNRLKIDKNEHIVYSKTEIENNVYPKFVPFLNIKGDLAESINSEIDSFVSNALAIDQSVISYAYNISGNYLSLVVRTEDYSYNYGPNTNIKTYVIDLKNLQLLTDDQVLQLYNLTSADVSRILETDFRGYYEDIINEGYYTSNKCNYNCFLNNRGVSNYLDNVNYYISNGNLIAYKPYILYSALDDAEYFSPENYEFVIVESVDK